MWQRTARLFVLFTLGTLSICECSHAAGFKLPNLNPFQKRSMMPAKKSSLPDLSPKATWNRLTTLTTKTQNLIMSPWKKKTPRPVLRPPTGARPIRNVSSQKSKTSFFPSIFRKPEESRPSKTISDFLGQERPGY